MKPLVGLMPLYDFKKDSYWMVPGYMKMLEENGAIPIILPLTDNREELDYFINICSGFLLTGGQDVSPTLYNEETLGTCGEVCHLRDLMEKYIILKSLKLNKSIFGICRGVQILNVVLGGSLYQDLPTQCNLKTKHKMTPPYDKVCHNMNIICDTPLYDIIKSEKIGVNSYHHQAVKDISEKLKPCAVSEDGVVEGLYMPNKKFVLGVQWHPEFSYKTDENSLKIIKAFVLSMM
ncbi:MAG: gamma-glutamyl-gamma-aminobutyrate hydrolase family protein [Lachnospirales bacterium]